MPHEIYVDANGKAAIAFTGSRDQIWHRLGQELDQNATLEEWQVQSGMNWEVRESNIQYYANTDFGWKPDSIYPNRKVLYRGDNGAPLSIVSDEFKVVQPKEVLEFFRELIESHGMKMSTAGCLFGGKRFWALADTGNTSDVIPGDKIKSYLFFSTSVDGTLATTAKFSSTRVVCNNTMQIALKENALSEESTKNVVRKTHRSVWDHTQAYIDLGLLSNSFSTFLNDLRSLADRKMTDKEVITFFKKTCFDPKKEADEQSWGAIRNVSQLSHLYRYGEGADMAYGTAYGALNAVTNLYTHGRGRKSPDKILWEAWAENNKIKDQAFQDLLEMV